MRQLALTTWLLSMACTGSPAEKARPDAVQVAGDETLTDSLMQRLGTTYERSFPGFNLQVLHTDTSDAFTRFINGTASIVATTRVHTPAEAERAAAQGVDLNDPALRSIVGVNVVTIAVHPSIPLDSLTYEHIIGIFCTQDVNLDNWAFLGLDDQPVSAMTSLAPDSGERVLFEDFFCGPRGLRGVKEVSRSEVERALREEPGTITFLSLHHRAGKLLKLRPDPESPAIAPSQQNIIRGAYPLAHDLFLYTRTTDPKASNFVEWIRTPAGQEEVDEEGFVPLYLRPERMDGPRPLRETVHFETDSDKPTYRSHERLELLVDELRSRAGEYNHVILEGYADATEAAPIELSRSRASTVEKMLSAKLPGLFYEIIPRGGEHPIAPNETPYGRQRNRRVQIYLAEEEGGSAIETSNEG